MIERLRYVTFDIGGRAGTVGGQEIVGERGSQTPAPAKSAPGGSDE